MVKLYQTLLKSSLEFDAKFGAKATEEKKKKDHLTHFEKWPKLYEHLKLPHRKIKEN